jgi:hypothetical protein
MRTAIDIIGTMFPDWMHGLSSRAKRCLLAGGYATRKDVVFATDEELLAVRGLGSKTMRELNTWRRPSTKEECESVAAWLQTEKALSRYTREASELGRSVLLANPSDKEAKRLRPGVLEMLYPIAKRWR